jgi:hypothetical protein
MNKMSGMSLAALLGAATWFGHEAEQERNPKPETSGEPPPAADDAAEPPEFIWAPNSLFQ